MSPFFSVKIVFDDKRAIVSREIDSIKHTQIQTERQTISSTNMLIKYSSSKNNSRDLGNPVQKTNQEENVPQ